MVLHLSEAAADDVDRIAEIHLAAFDSNVLLHAQFPTKASLEWLHSILSREMLSAIQNEHDSGKAVLIVKDTDADNQIISFAKWDLPVGFSKGSYHSNLTWPEDCRQEYLEQYYELAEATKNRVVGDQPCYRKNEASIHPYFPITILASSLPLYY